MTPELISALATGIAGVIGAITALVIAMKAKKVANAVNHVVVAAIKRGVEENKESGV